MAQPVFTRNLVTTAQVITKTLNIRFAVTNAVTLELYSDSTIGNVLRKTMPSSGSGDQDFDLTYAEYQSWASGGSLYRVDAIGSGGEIESSIDMVINWQIDETIDQALAQKADIGIRYGNPTYTGVTLVAATLNDPGVNAVFVNYNGKSEQISMVPVGTDAPVGHPFNGMQAGWVGNINITGLDLFPNRTPFTVTQGVNTESGRFIPLPNEVQSGSFYFATCDYPYGGYIKDSLNTPPQEPAASGAWKNIYEDTDDSLFAVFMIDDTSYPDAMYVNDLASSGHVISDISAGSNSKVPTITSYDYCLAYFANLGMFDFIDMDNFSLTNYRGWEQYKGRSTYRLWCWRNLNYIPQHGDHELTNDFGLTYGRTRTGMASMWTACITNTYDHFMKPLQGGSIANKDANANHWSIGNGLFKIVVGDGLYNGSGDWVNATGIITTMFGDNQIDDILEAFDSDEPFKIFANVFQMKWLDSSDPTNNRQNGASWPLFNRNIGEYKRLVTNTVVDASFPQKSIMNNDKTNGTLGVCVSISGDYHHMSVRKMSAPAYTDNALEDLSEWHSGTVAASTNFLFNYTQGQTYEDQLLEYNAAKWGSELAPSVRMASGVIKVNIFAENVPRMIVTAIDLRGTGSFNAEEKVEFSKEYIAAFVANSGQAVGETSPKKASPVSISNGGIDCD